MSLPRTSYPTVHGPIPSFSVLKSPRLVVFPPLLVGLQTPARRNVRCKIRSYSGLGMPATCGRPEVSIHIHAHVVSHGLPPPIRPILYTPYLASASASLSLSLADPHSPPPLVFQHRTL